jgi:hypothetical protein
MLLVIEVIYTPKIHPNTPTLPNIPKSDSARTWLRMSDVRKIK